MSVTADLYRISIHNLNDDCLLHIMKLLKLSDRSNAGEVCQRWRNLASLLWKKVVFFDVTNEQLDFKEFCDLNDEDSNAQICQRVFLKCFSNLTTINLSRSRNLRRGVSLFNFTHCCGGISFPLYDYKRNNDMESTLNNFKSLLFMCENIEELLLCHCVVHVDDEFLKQLFIKNKKLRSFGLSSFELTGKYFLKRTKFISAKDTKKMNVRCILMNDLNDDCLVHIFKFVSLADKLNVEAVCLRWQGLCSLVWKKTQLFNVTEQYPHKFKFKNNYDDIDVQIYQVVFSKCYEYLSMINLSRGPRLQNVVFTEVGHDCPVNLLEVPRMVPPDGTSKLKGTLNALKYSLLECKHLEELSLCHCVINVDDEYLSRLFKKNRKLRSIVLSKYRLIGKCFNDLSPVTLESIIIYNCEMDFRYFNPILPLASKLHTLRLDKTWDINFGSKLRVAPSTPTNLLQLSIQYYDEVRCLSDIYQLNHLMSLKLSFVELKDSMLKLIVKNCTQLRQLDLTCNTKLHDSSLRCIKSLPLLVCLGIGFNEQFTDAGLATLSNDLRELDVSFISFSEKGLLKIIRKMQCLEQLDVSHNRHLNHNFVQSVMTIVNDRPNRIPLTLGVCGLNSSWLETKKIIESKLINICPRVKLVYDDRLTMKYDRYV
ncbi:hypothetical protein QAD02_004492 [Eretmocerus hayati]|uniref:Uncharacterized protein n=1 Tax=Eretmocerus hayati TaxID=131215 RepID=A0ACC2NUK0_9HYME|nr:hypothetical protein QAD02_004492 [Eretmocerus hayati]